MNENRVAFMKLIGKRVGIVQWEETTTYKKDPTEAGKAFGWKSAMLSTLLVRIRTIF